MKDAQQGAILLTGKPDCPGEAALTSTEDKLTIEISRLRPLPISESEIDQAPDRQFTGFTSLLQQILQIVSSSSELQTTLEQILSLIGEAFQADHCLLHLSLLDNPTICWSSGQGPTNVSSLVKGLTFATLFDARPGTSLNPVCIIQTETSSHQAPQGQDLINLWQAVLKADMTYPARATLGLVTRPDALPKTLLSLVRQSSKPWTAAEIESLSLTVQQVAIVLSQRQVQQQLNRQKQYQAVVNQLTMAIRNSSNLHEILQLALDGTARALGAQRGMLLRLKYWDPLFRSRFQEQLPKVRVTVAYEWLNPIGMVTPEGAIDGVGEPSSPSSDTQKSFWMTECQICQTAFTTSSQPLVVADCQKLPELLQGAAAVFHPMNFPALLVMPLESQGTVLGFLVLQHHQLRVWQPEEVHLVELVSAQISTAIIQAETLRQVQALVEKRTAELRESLSVQAKLYERTRQQVDQLRHLNQLKDEFLSTVSHELRTPLTSMTMAIRMLKQSGLSTERGSRYLDILEQQCAQETNLINDLLALQELESKQVQIQLQELDLKQLIQELTASFEQQWVAKGLTLQLNLPPKPLKLQSDRDSIIRILTELLTNAGKYSEPHSQVSLSVASTTQTNLDTIVLTLSNRGPGISPEELPHIFDKFSRCQGATQNAIQGTGLGLALVKSLVQNLNGAITASSCDSEQTDSCETCFTLTLPRRFDLAKL